MAKPSLLVLQKSMGTRELLAHFNSMKKQGSLLTLAKQSWYHSKCRRTPIPLCPKSNPFYQPLLPARHPTRIPGKCWWLHGRRKGRKRGYRQRWSENGQSSSESKSGKIYFYCRRKLRVSSILSFPTFHKYSRKLADGDAKGRGIMACVDERIPLASCSCGLMRGSALWVLINCLLSCTLCKASEPKKTKKRQRKPRRRGRSYETRLRSRVWESIPQQGYG